MLKFGLGFGYYNLLLYIWVSLNQNKMIMEIQITEQQKESIENMSSMMESCFTYGGVDKNSYNYERYIKKYEEELGETLFSLTYMTKKIDLEQNYEVLSMTSQDGEGNWYNTLKRK